MIARLLLETGIDMPHSAIIRGSTRWFSGDREDPLTVLREQESAVPQDTSIPIGLCQCGCGRPTKIARQTCTRRGDVKGQPVRFVMGHNGTRPTRNDFVVRPDGRVDIFLTHGQVAVVDAEDFERIRDFRYYAHRDKATWYARRSGKSDDGEKVTVSMHQDILGEVEGTIDHIDGDGLHNWRSNLRPATRSQQAQNRRTRRRDGGPKGVTLSLEPRCAKKPWKAVLNGKYLGAFSTEEAAADAYDRAAREAYGEYARTNRP